MAYRPISDTLFISKIIELLAYGKLCKFDHSRENIIKSSRFLHYLYKYDFADFSAPEFCRIERIEKTGSVMLQIKTISNKRTSKFILTSIRNSIYKDESIIGCAERRFDDGYSIFFITF